MIEHPLLPSRERDGRRGGQGEGSSISHTPHRLGSLAALE